MKTEIEHASIYIVGLLKQAPQLSIAGRSAALKTILIRHITEKLRTTIWDPKNPMRGNGYRSIFTSDGIVDPIISLSVSEAGLDSKSLIRYLPSDFVVWVDPGSVSYRIGEHGTLMTVYDEKSIKMKTNSMSIAVNNSSNLMKTSIAAGSGKSATKVTIKNPAHLVGKNMNSAGKEPDQHSPSLSPLVV
jgi:hypothetical protein